jgi:hypothetical protein
VQVDIARHEKAIEYHQMASGKVKLERPWRNSSIHIWSLRSLRIEALRTGGSGEEAKLVEF